MSKKRLKTPGIYRVVAVLDPEDEPFVGQDIAIIDTILSLGNTGYHNIVYRPLPPKGSKPDSPFPRVLRGVMVRRLRGYDYYTCNCGAYSYPHRVGSGLCDGEAVRQEFLSGEPVCSTCPYRFDDYCGLDCDFDLWQRSCPELLRRLNLQLTGLERY